MQPRIPFLSIYSLLLFVSLILTGCGGGGGGASSDGSLVYTGLTDPAQITASNAEALATSAFEGGSFINAGGMTKSQSLSSSVIASKKTLTPLFLKTIKQALNASRWIPTQASSAKVSAASSNGQGDASCAEGPGKFEYTLTYYPDYTAKAVFIYSAYCSRGTRLTGSANVHLLYNSQTLRLSEFMISFGRLQIESSTISSTASGSVRVYNLLDSSYNETINMLVMDSVSSKIYKTEDLETVNIIGSNYFDMSVTGGVFYHPDYGFVSMSTTSPVRYFDDAERPYSGFLRITGRSGSNALLIFYFSDYRVQADTNGNGSYELDSGMRGWDGADPTGSTAPTANAGADQGTDVGQTVTLDGSGSVSYQNGASLIYHWSIISAPGGSSATLVDQNTVAPKFTPDRGGAYKIALAVNDGNFESQADQVSVTVRNDTIFAPYQVISSFRGAKAVAVGDVNGDGRDDVALVMGLSFEPTDKNRLHVFLQNASGGLDPAVKYEVSAITESVVSGDFNNDGRTDLVVGTWGGITVFLQNDSGGLVSSAFHPTKNSLKLATGDFNNDGRLDVAGLGAYTSQVHVLLQSSARTLSDPVIYTMAHGEFELIDTGDVNGDSLSDIVVMCRTCWSYDFATLLQNSEGTFDTPIYYKKNAYSEGMAVGDVNGDNRDDIFMTFSSKIGVFLQNAQGEIGQQVDYLAYYFPGPVLIGDVTQDGRNEVMVLHYDYALDVYVQGDSWNFNGSKKYALPSGSSRYDARALAAGDLNGDGRKDIAIADSVHGLVVLYNIY